MFICLSVCLAVSVCGYVYGSVNRKMGLNASDIEEFGFVRLLAFIRSCLSQSSAFATSQMPAFLHFFLSLFLTHSYPPFLPSLHGVLPHSYHPSGPPFLEGRWS